MFLPVALRLSDYTMTSGAVAARLGVNIDTVARWADTGKLRCARTPGGFRRFRPADVDAFAEEMLKGAAS